MYKVPAIYRTPTDGMKKYLHSGKHTVEGMPEYGNMWTDEWMGDD